MNFRGSSKGISTYVNQNRPGVHEELSLQAESQAHVSTKRGLRREWRGGRREWEPVQSLAVGAEMRGAWIRFSLCVQLLPAALCLTIARATQFFE